MTRLLGLDISPTNAVGHLRGEVVDANYAYPEVLQIHVQDPDGRAWHLSTLDASWTPTDPDALCGRTIVDGTIDAATGVLRLVFEDGDDFVVRPDPQAAHNDPPTWELITPDRVCLEFGPRQQWTVTPGDAPIAPR